MASANGSLGILNVGAGDIKLSFDPANPSERIRAARIVTDMLRRGYALLVAVPDGDGGTIYTRATDFDEATCEYLIADFDPMAAFSLPPAATAVTPDTSAIPPYPLATTMGAATPTPTKDTTDAQDQKGQAAGSPAEGGEEDHEDSAKKRRGRPIKVTRVPAHQSRAVAVARSAGG